MVNYRIVRMYSLLGNCFTYPSPFFATQRASHDVRQREKKKHRDYYYHY